jgi:transcriptional regulator with XRE-family HTH domain
MAGYKKDAPAEFAQLVASAIRDQMAARDMSGRALARRIGMSEKYIRERLALKFEFSLNDVQQFCRYIGVDPVDFVGSLDRSVLNAPAVVETDDVDVSGLSEDELRSRYALAANNDESADRLDPDTQ